MRALIIGGSLGGLFAACALRRHGLEVEVFERVPVRLSGRGAGIATHRPLLQALEAVASEADLELGAPVRCRVAFDRSGAPIATLARPQIMTAWSRIYSLLDAAYPEVRRGWTLQHYEQDADGVTAYFEGGRVARGDILVGADGIRSAVRRQMFPEIRAQYAGYIAWRGLVDEAALSPATHADLFEQFAFTLPEGEQMLGYPVAGDDDDIAPGRRRYNFVWYRPVDAAELPALQTDASGKTYPDGIPPHLIRPELIAAMRRDAEAVLSPQFIEVVRLCAAPFFQPISDLEVPAMVQGRVALLGDAAFVVRPHLGMGVTKAAQDAMTLAACLVGAAPDEALRRYGAQREPAGVALVRRARDLGAYMQAQRRSEAERAAAARHRTPEAVLAETAWMDDT